MLSAFIARACFLLSLLVLLEMVEAGVLTLTLSAAVAVVSIGVAVSWREFALVVGDNRETPCEVSIGDEALKIVDDARAVAAVSWVTLMLGLDGLSTCLVAVAPFIFAISLLAVVVVVMVVGLWLIAALAAMVVGLWLISALAAMVVTIGVESKTVDPSATRSTFVITTGLEGVAIAGFSEPNMTDGCDCS